MNGRPEGEALIGSLVRLVNTPNDRRDGCYFRVTHAWYVEHLGAWRYSAEQYVGAEAPDGERALYISGGTWNVPIEAEFRPSQVTPREVAAPTSRPRANLVGHLVSQHTQDSLLSRRQSWDGAVIQGLNVPGDPQYGHYYRVTRSWRDQQTGEWNIESDYLGPERPQGEPVYKFDGTTWDLPAFAMTVAPRKTLWVLGVLYGLYLIFAGIPNPIMILFTVCIVGWNWFYRTEPVRGTKVLAAYEANRAYRRAHQQPNEYNGGPDWRTTPEGGGQTDRGFVKEYRARREAEEGDRHQAALIEKAVQEALRKQQRPQSWQ